MCFLPEVQYLKREKQLYLELIIPQNPISAQGRVGMQQSTTPQPGTEGERESRELHHSRCLSPFSTSNFLFSGLKFDI